MRRPVKDNKRAAALDQVAARFKQFRPASAVLSVVRAVPTRFVQFDHAVRVGGFPIERYALVHGPSNEGKTAAVLGLVDSFLARGHFALYIDAERTTPITWVRELMGARAEHPRFFAVRPDTYEGTIAQVREFLNTVANLRAEGKVAPGTSAIVICDSLRKLVPADLMKEILKAEADGDKIKGGRDRGGQLKAKMNAAWMDELVPLLEYAQAAFVAIARESVDPDADVWAKRRGDDYVVGGGAAIYYDASLVIRVERAGWVTEKKGDDEKAKAAVYGERHRLTIRKTKVAGKDDRVAVGHFHTSNGVLVPAGFDRARDVLELAERFGVVKAAGKGGWLHWGKCRWQGRHAAVRKLTADADKLCELEMVVRGRFDVHEPVAHDPETGEVA